MMHHQNNLSNQYGNTSGNSGNISRSSQVAGIIIERMWFFFKKK